MFIVKSHERVWGTFDTEEEAMDFVAFNDSMYTDEDRVKIALYYQFQIYQVCWPIDLKAELSIWLGGYERD